MMRFRAQMSNKFSALNFVDSKFWSNKSALIGISIE